VFCFFGGKMFDQIKYDIKTIRERDPAARNNAEVFFLYPGFKAIFWHRIAHKLYNKKHFFLARWISQSVRNKTGIEIHPAAKIGKGLFIDHGGAVVIGETAEIGDDCTIYQGVTLGGTGLHKGKRHPTLGNGVLVGAGAKILGPFKVGDNAKVAAGAVVLEPIPDNSTAVGVPARVVKKNGVRVNSEMDQIHIPDPVSQEICKLQKRLEDLEKQMEDKKGENL
jgi:serine O-acetyltransferase